MNTTREHTMVDSLVFGTPRGGAAKDRGPVQDKGANGETPKVICFINAVTFKGVELEYIERKKLQKLRDLSNINYFAYKIIA